MTLTLWVYSADDFGAAVVDQLVKLVRPRVVLRIHDQTAMELGLKNLHRGDIFLFISLRPRDSISSTINARCCETGSAFLQVVVVTPILQLGPLVQVPGSACWECWRERERANHPLAEQRLALFDYYDKETSKPPSGYMPFLTGVAAGKAASILNHTDTFREHLGLAWAMNMWTKEISRARFVGRHGCVHCGLGHADQEDQTLAMYYR